MLFEMRTKRISCAHNITLDWIMFDQCSVYVPEVVYIDIRNSMYVTANSDQQSSLYVLDRFFLSAKPP